MVAVIDPLSGVVSMVDTLLTRLDAREAKLKQRVDLLDALVDLLHVLRLWTDAAAQTDVALSQWIKAPLSQETQRILYEARRGQQGWMDQAFTMFSPSPEGSPEEKRAQATLSDVLYAYVPEFEADFAKVASDRKALLYTIAGVVPEEPNFLSRAVAAAFPGRTAPKKPEEAEMDLRAFEQSTANLYRTMRQLADFINTRFDANDIAIRA